MVLGHFEVVAWLQPQTVMKLFRNHNLPAGSELHGGGPYRLVTLSFHIFILESPLTFVKLKGRGEGLRGWWSYSSRWTEHRLEEIGRSARRSWNDLKPWVFARWRGI